MSEKLTLSKLLAKKEERLGRVRTKYGEGHGVGHGVGVVNIPNKKKNGNFNNL